MTKSGGRSKHLTGRKKRPAVSKAKGNRGKRTKRLPKTASATPEKNLLVDSVQIRGTIQAFHHAAPPDYRDFELPLPLLMRLAKEVSYSLPGQESALRTA
jgi:hypothetical protein